MIYGINFLTVCCANRITFSRITYISKETGNLTSIPRSSDAFNSNTRFFISDLDNYLYVSKYTQTIHVLMLILQMFYLYQEDHKEEDEEAISQEINK